MDDFQIRFPQRETATRFIIGSGSLDFYAVIESHSAPSADYFLIDSNVLHLHSSPLRRLGLNRSRGDRVYEVLSGERAKNSREFMRIHKWLLANGADRKSRLIVAGGGVTTDLGGFVASTFMRGIDYVFVPTTLLAQIDAAIGGKNSINTEDAKNIIGTVTHPGMTVIDPIFLKTLSTARIREGMAELIKMAAVSSKRLIGILGRLRPEDFPDATRLAATAIIAGARAKLDIVRKDPYESGLRKILNFGHTTAHAIESLAGYGAGMTHGKAVAFGMLVAAELSSRIYSLDHDAVSWIETQIRGLYRSFKLPTISAGEVWVALQTDKKREQGRANFVLIRKLGDPVVAPVTKRAYISAFNAVAARWVVHK